MTIQRQRSLAARERWNRGGRYSPQAFTYPNGRFLRYGIANHRFKQSDTAFLNTGCMFLRHVRGMVLRLSTAVKVIEMNSTHCDWRKELPAVSRAKIFDEPLRCYSPVGQ